MARVGHTAILAGRYNILIHARTLTYARKAQLVYTNVAFYLQIKSDVKLKGFETLNLSPTFKPFNTLQL